MGLHRRARGFIVGSHRQGRGLFVQYSYSRQGQGLCVVVGFTQTGTWSLCSILTVDRDKVSV